MQNKKKIVILTGAGMSEESGISTFRDKNGLWENHDITKVASPKGFRENPELVLEFYNQRRRQLKECKPNKGHILLSDFQTYYDIQIITTNVDDLHERAGSKNILHIHGLLNEAKSQVDKNEIYNLEYRDINIGDLCKNGAQLRPNIVWFGENVPNIEKAQEICGTADIFLIVGTSMSVYPAASLIDYIPNDIPIYVVDPNLVYTRKKVEYIPYKASEGIQKFFNLIEIV